MSIHLVILFISLTLGDEEEYEYEYYRGREGDTECRRTEMTEVIGGGGEERVSLRLHVRIYIFPNNRSNWNN
ncbi:hypothetical protein HanIR_Chr12g0561461 [Helianthus annuus]|nr:hypothetical protein HanIR_Chr12g0561461 [Helianthus annuus]